MSQVALCLCSGTRAWCRYTNKFLPDSLEIRYRYNTYLLHYQSIFRKNRRRLPNNQIKIHPSSHLYKLFTKFPLFPIFHYLPYTKKPLAPL